jgi:hypothetical protein
MNIEIEEIKIRLAERKQTRITLKDIYGFVKSFAADSAAGKKLMEGNKEQQAAFLYHSTLQFYYEFNVRLKSYIRDVKVNLGYAWKLKVNMKTN